MKCCYVVFIALLEFKPSPVFFLGATALLSTQVKSQITDPISKKVFTMYIVNPIFNYFIPQFNSIQRLHKGVICKFSVQLIHYFGSNKSVGLKTGKLHLCVNCFKKRLKKTHMVLCRYLLANSMYSVYFEELEHPNTQLMYPPNENLILECI